MTRDRGVQGGLRPSMRSRSARAAAEPARKCASLRALERRGRATMLDEELWQSSFFVVSARIGNEDKALELPSHDVGAGIDPVAQRLFLLQQLVDTYVAQRLSLLPQLVDT